MGIVPNVALLAFEKIPSKFISLQKERNPHLMLLRIIVLKDKYFYANPARLFGQSVKSLSQKMKKEN